MHADVGHEASALSPHLSLLLVGSVHADVGYEASALSPHLSLLLVHADVSPAISGAYKMYRYIKIKLIFLKIRT